MNKKTVNNCTELYERTELVITEFDAEDVITTSGEVPTTAPNKDKYEGGIYG